MRLLALLTVVLTIFLVGCSDEGSLPLHEWKYIEGAGAPPAPVVLPAHVTPKPNAVYRLQRVVELPPEWRGKRLELSLPGLRAWPVLRAGGFTLMPQDQSPVDRYRRSQMARFVLPEAITSTPTLQLEIEVKHQWVYSAWIEGAPVLAPADAFNAPYVMDTVNRFSALTALATTAFVAVLYGYLFLSVRGPRRKTYGLFAIGEAAYTSYPAILLGYTQPLLGVYETSVAVFMLISGAALAVSFTRSYFGQPRPHWAWKAWVLGCGLVAIVVRDPFRVVSLMGPLAFVTTSANAIAQFLLVLHLRKLTPRPKNIYLIALAWPATTLFGVPDVLGWMSLGGPFGELRSACIGMTVISLLQAAALLRDHLRSLKRADVLNTELQSRVSMLETKERELELLNDELRRQIGARSRQLVDTLANTQTPTPLVRLVLKPGDLIERRYRVLRLVGEGGMGAVYEVERLVDTKRFAMKTLTGVGDPVARARFAREAQIAANVKHPNVVALIDFDVSKDGYLFLVMELIDGNTLTEVRKRALDIPWTLNVLAQVAEGLDAIHALGIIHRDLKPANVLFSRGTDGRRPLVKITDFGVSSMIADEIHSQPGLRAAAISPESSNQLPPVTGPQAADALATRKQGRGLQSDAPRDADGKNPAPKNAAAHDALDPSDPEEIEDLTSRSFEMMLEPEVHATGFTTPSGPPRAPNPSLPAIEKRSLDRAAGPALTRPGIVFGTPNYMAAELITGKSSKAADIFSLAVIAFELLTLKRPFRQCPLRVAIKKQPLPEVPCVADYVPGLDREVAEMIQRALGHQPDVRPTAREMADTFRKHSGGVSAESSGPRPSVHIK